MNGIVINNLPIEILESTRAVNWKGEPDRKGRPTKVPYNARRPDEKAAVNRPDTWATFSEALATYEDGKADGVGIVLVGDGLVGIDLDGCIDEDGAISSAAWTIVREIDSYTERSPSGRGLRIFVQGGLPAGRRAKQGEQHTGIEMYSTLKYLTVTGQHLEGTPRTIEIRPAELATLHARVFAPAPRTQTAQKPLDLDPDDDPVEEPNISTLDADDAALISKAAGAKNGRTFTALWNGRHAAHPSHSEADLALCRRLAYWTDGDGRRIDRLFRASGLMSTKWDKRRGDQTYGERTIATVLTTDRPSIERADPFAASEPDDPPDAEPDDPPVPPLTIVTPDSSFITRYVSYAQQRTDAPPIAHELIAVTLLSALAGPIPRILLAARTAGLRLVIWAMYIVNSTIGRKTTVLEFGVDLLQAVLGSEALIYWEGSPQGFVQRLQTRDHHAAVFVRDEYSGLLRMMNKNGGHLAGLVQTFIRAFDGKPLENIRTRKRTRGGELRDDSDRVNEPFLVKMTAATWDSFITAATLDNVYDGLLPRFIFATGAATPAPMKLFDPALQQLREDLLAHARSFHQRASQTAEILVTEEVLAAAWVLEQAWQQAAARSLQPAAAGASFKRLSDAVLIVAALLALDDEQVSPVTITIAHFTTATQMAERWRRSTTLVLNALGHSEFGGRSEAILATIGGQPDGISLSRLYRAHRNLRQRDFNEVLGALEDQELITRVRVERTGGRPRIVFHLASKWPR